MSINDHYVETLEVIHAMFKHIFNGLESRWAKQLSVIREQYPSEPVAFTEEMCLLHWPEAIEIWKEAGFDVGDGMLDPNGEMVRVNTCVLMEFVSRPQPAFSCLLRNWRLEKQ